MPDAREMLKKLAKDNRHKRVDIKIPDVPTRPAPPKKIKRTGPTRPYHLVEAEDLDKERPLKDEEDNRSGAVADSSGDRIEVEDPPIGDSSTALVDSPQASPASRSIEKGEEKQKSTDIQEADIRLPEYREAFDKTTDSAEGVGVNASLLESQRATDLSIGVSETRTPVSTANFKGRGRGETVTNLVKRSLIQPDWQIDLTRDEGFLRVYFRDVYGKGKMAKEVDLYCQLYAEARRKQTATLHFLSVELGELVGSSSNGTIRTRLLAVEKLGLLAQQGFNNETKDHKRGTYIHLRCPWI